MLVAVVIERLALNFERWHYGTDMLVLPGLAVGLLPVVQMGVLPLLSVLLAGCLAPNVTSDVRHNQFFARHAVWWLALWRQYHINP